MSRVSDSMPWLEAPGCLPPVFLAAAGHVFGLEIEQFGGALRPLDGRGDGPRRRCARTATLYSTRLATKGSMIAVRVELEDRRQHGAHLFEVVGLGDADRGAEMRRLDDHRESRCPQRRLRARPCPARGRSPAARPPRRAAARCRARPACAWSPPCPSARPRPGCACRYRARSPSRTRPVSAPSSPILPWKASSATSKSIGTGFLAKSPPARGASAARARPTGRDRPASALLRAASSGI